MAGRLKEIPLKEIPAALAAREPIVQISREIRARHGLPPVPEPAHVKRWRERLAAADAKPVDEVALRRQLKAARTRVANLS